MTTGPIAAAMMIFVTAVSQYAMGYPGSREKKEPRTAPHRPAPSTFARGTVIETMDAKRYTYVLLDTGGPKIWAAGPKITVKVGDMISLPKGTQMKDFSSPSLNRTFDEIYFVWRIIPEQIEATLPLPVTHPRIATNQLDAVSVPDVKKAPGKMGRTVAEVYSQKEGLAGKKVAVRGIVVKFNAGIMSRNWLHIKDGSGQGTSGALVATTEDMAQIGDIVSALGTVLTNQNFGFGYRYEVILDKAKITVEESGAELVPTGQSPSADQ